MSGCEEVRELLIAVARDEAVSLAGEKFVRDHVHSCPDCRRLLANQRMLSAGLSSVAAAAVTGPPPALKAALLSEFRRQQKVTPIRRPIFKWTAVAAAAAAAILIAFLAIKPRHETPRVAHAPALEPAARVRATHPAPPPVPEPKPHVVAKTRRAPPVPKPAAAPVPAPQPAAQEPTEIASDFFEIPYAEPLRPDQRADVFRIEMPRAGMAAYGLPVTGGRLDCRIKADVLMGEDGVARALRFIR
jgi:hypothetical protein